MNLKIFSMFDKNTILRFLEGEIDVYVYDKMVSESDSGYTFIATIVAEHSLRGDITVESIVNFPNIALSSLKMSNGNKNFALESVSGGKISIPVISNLPDLPAREVTNVGDFPIDGNALQAAINTVKSIKTMKVLTRCAETEGISFEEKYVYATNGQSLIKTQGNVIHGITSRITLPWKSVSTLTQLINHFGPPECAVYENKSLNFMFENGSFITLRCLFTRNPLPFNKVIESGKNDDKVLVEISEKTAEVFHEVARLGCSVYVEGDQLTAESDGKFKFSYTLEEPYSESKVEFTPSVLSDLSSCLKECRITYLPLTKSILVENEAGLTQACFSLNVIK